MAIDVTATSITVALAMHPYFLLAGVSGLQGIPICTGLGRVTGLILRCWKEMLERDDGEGKG